MLKAMPTKAKGPYTCQPDKIGKQKCWRINCPNQFHFITSYDPHPSSMNARNPELEKRWNATTYVERLNEAFAAGAASKDAEIKRLHAAMNSVLDAAKTRELANGDLVYRIPGSILAPMEAVLIQSKKDHP